MPSSRWHSAGPAEEAPPRMVGILPAKSLSARSKASTGGSPPPPVEEREHRLRRRPADRDAALAQPACDRGRFRQRRRRGRSRLPHGRAAPRTGRGGRRCPSSCARQRRRSRMPRSTPLNSRWTSRSSARSARTATIVPPSARISATVASALRLMVEVDHDDAPAPSAPAGARHRGRFRTAPPVTIATASRPGALG